MRASVFASGSNGGAKWAHKSHFISCGVADGSVTIKMLLKKAKEQGMF
jgi:hypothetical protein